jgi:hypothetical protein
MPILICFVLTRLSFVGIFQIIKGLLPKKVLDRMKFINSKTAKNYISESHQPKEWGNGLDDYELKFEPENYECNDNISRADDIKKVTAFPILNF